MEGPKAIHKQHHEPYKVCTVGTSCGKSCLILRLIHGSFDESVDPTIEDNYCHVLQLGDKEISIHILDTAGTSSFDDLEDKWFKWGDLYLLCYSISSKESFNLLTKYYQHIKQIKESFPLILVGTQSDKEDSRQVTQEEGKRLAQKWDCPFFETSAKEGQNVDTVFKSIVDTIESWKRKQRRHTVSFTGELKQLDNNKSKRKFSLSSKSPSKSPKESTGALFGVPIDSVPRTVNPFVPDFVLQVFDYLRKTDAVHVEGLFRISANATSVSNIKAMLDKGEPVDFTQISPCDCHVVAGLFKAWLKQLPAPLLTFELYPKFVSMFASLDDASSVYKMDKLLNKLPQTNYRVLWELLDFVGEMLPHVAENKMTPSNLSTVFGPCICFPKSLDPLKQLEDLKCVNGIVQFIFQHYSELKELQDVSSVQLRTPPKASKPKAPASPTSLKRAAKTQWRKTMAMGATAVMNHLIKTPTRKSLSFPVPETEERKSTELQRLEHLKALNSPKASDKKEKKKFFTMRL